jgi:tryptophan-rich sensory protein
MSKRMALNWLVTAAAGLIANLFALRMGEIFDQFRLPLFFPPVWLLPLGWTVALICLVSAYTRMEDESPKAAMAFYVALGLVVCRELLFFRVGALFAAAISGMILTGVLLHMKRLAEASGSGKRFLPCCMWAGYMTYINLGICLMN